MNIIIARDPSTRAKVFRLQDAAQHIEPGWEFVEVDARCIPRPISWDGLWNWVLANHREHIQIWDDSLVQKYPVDLEEAKAIKIKNILRAREHKLKQLDIQWFKA